jgi:arsenate reductase
VLEVGIDLTAAKPKKLTAELAQDADVLITMGCGEDCPYVPGLRRDDCHYQIPRTRELIQSGGFGKKFEYGF